MATKKDLVEAYSFSRRRLVTAFVSGAPGGREVEPARPGRAIIGGIAIAVLLLAGAAVLKFLGSPAELDDDTAQLISEKESGADYVLIGGPGTDQLTLRPVVNITSAMLLLGSDIEPTVVPRAKLTDLDPGAPIGILQAPATPPPVDALIGSGWTACTGVVDGQPVGLKISVSTAPDVVPTPGVSFVVRAVGADSDDARGSDEKIYLIAESSRGTADRLPRAYSYELSQDVANADGLLSAVAGGSRAAATEVPAEWVTTFPPGGALDLTTLGLDPGEVGDRFPGRPDDGPLAKARVGDLYEADGRSYLLMPDGTTQELDDFALAVYLGAVPGGVSPQDLPSGETSPPGVEIQQSPVLDGSRWPEATTTEQPSGELCSLLTAAPGAAPYANLALSVPGGGASAEGIEPGPPVASVDPGAGAFVRSGGWFDEEAPTRVLVDDRAFSYGVAGPEEALNLGYGSLAPEVVPDSWLELFTPGVLLSIEAARCPPTSRARAAPCG